MWNFKGTSEDYIRDIVFSNNGYHLPKNVEFGFPRHFEPLPRDPKKNDTLLRIWHEKGRCEPFDGHTTITYRRMFLEYLKSNPLATIALPQTEFTIWSILDQINAFYKTNFLPSDVVNSTYPPNTFPIMLTAAADSLAWQGSVAMPVAFDLAAAIEVVDLDGFDPSPLVDVPDLDGFKQYQPA